MSIRKIQITLATAIVTLTAFATVASANHLSFSSQTWRATWTSFEFSGGFGTWKCNLTLEGSLHSRTINKTVGALIGFVTRASVGPCPQGSATILTATLPWHMWYSGFAGTLPRIASITLDIIGMAWQIREPLFGITCLARSEANEPATSQYNLTSGSLTSVVLGGEFETTCGLRGTITGTSATNSALTISLI